MGDVNRAVDNRTDSGLAEPSAALTIRRYGVVPSTQRGEENRKDSAFLSHPLRLESSVNAIISVDMIENN
jgi:hypothetical protein